MNLERSPRPQNMQVWADMGRTVESNQSVTGIHRRFPVGSTGWTDWRWEWPPGCCMKRGEAGQAWEKRGQFGGSWNHPGGGWWQRILGWWGWRWWGHFGIYFHGRAKRMCWWPGRVTWEKDRHQRQSWCWARATVQTVVPFTEMGNTREEKV